MTPAIRVSDSNHESLTRLIEILAPGEDDLLAFFEAYFDESDSHDGAPALCVAAYLFEKEQCKLLDLEWKAVLDEYSLPFFHMVDCAHGAPPFSSLTKPQRIDVQTRMIDLVRKHMLFGAAITVNENEYNTWAARKIIGSAYRYCCWQTLAGIQLFMNRNGLKGEVAYFFEAGHESANETGMLMNQIAGHRDLRNQYRYGSHAFVQKEKSRPVQAPDILAWLHAGHFKRVQRGIFKPRADYVALVENKPHEMFIANAQTVAPALIHGGKALGVTGSFGEWQFWTPL